jgi:hypothetical protein
MFSSIFSKEDNRKSADQSTIMNESIDTSSHSSCEEVNIKNQVSPVDISSTQPSLNTEVPTDTEITVYQVASNLEDESEDDNIDMFNPFLNLEDALLKLAEKHELLDQELNKLTKTTKMNSLKQHALNEILKVISGLRSHRYSSEDAIISATLIINDALDRILTIFENSHYQYLNSFRRRTANFSLNINNTSVLNNLKSIDKEMLNRMIEKLILGNQQDYSSPQEPLVYTNPLNDKYFMTRDKKIVSMLKILSDFVEGLLGLISFDLDEHEEEKQEIPSSAQAIIDAQIDMIFEPLEQPSVLAKDSTRRKSKRRGGY